MVQRETLFLRRGNFSYICTQHCIRENGVFAKRQSWFWENNRSKPVLITLCKVLCHPSHVSIKSQVRGNSSAAKRDKLQYVKCHWKESEIYRFSRSATQNFHPWPTMVANIFEDSEAPSKKFLPTPWRGLLCYEGFLKEDQIDVFGCFCWLCYFCFIIFLLITEVNSSNEKGFFYFKI